jgi:putative transposase
MTYYQRHLPHWEPPGHDIFITWRLHGSLPKHFRLMTKSASQTKAKLDLAMNGRSEFDVNTRTALAQPAFAASALTASPKTALNKKNFLAYDQALDRAAIGPLWLNDPRIAHAVLAVLQAAQRQTLFTLRAYVLMANHVHVLLEPTAPIAKITQQIKGATARHANTILGHTGAQFWQDESFDHWIRTPQESQQVRAYIEQNPVAAGLVAKPEDWLWSSASR